MPGGESIDPLNFIEIQSAAQWKAMSQRISWKFDEEDESSKGSPLSEEDASAAESRLPGEEEAIKEDVFKPTKVEQLRLVCWRVKPWNQPRPRPGQPRLYSSQFAAAWGVDCDEVYPGLFIGDRKSAGHVKFLQKIGVTHVLNTAEGTEEGLVDLSQGSDQQSRLSSQFAFKCCNVLQLLLNTQENVQFHLNLHFNIQIRAVQNGFQMGNYSPAYLRPNLNI